MGQLSLFGAAHGRLMPTCIILRALEPQMANGRLSPLDSPGGRGYSAVVFYKSVTWVVCERSNTYEHSAGSFGAVDRNGRFDPCTLGDDFLVRIGCGLQDGGGGPTGGVGKIQSRQARAGRVPGILLYPSEAARQQ